MSASGKPTEDHDPLAPLDEAIERGLAAIRMQRNIVERLAELKIDSAEDMARLRALERDHAALVERRMYVSLSVLAQPITGAKRAWARKDTVGQLGMLARLERDILRGATLLDRQRAIIDALVLRGLDGEQARSLLRTFEQSQALRLAERDRIQKRFRSTAENGPEPATAPPTPAGKRLVLE